MGPAKFKKPRPFRFNEKIPSNVEECVQQMVNWGSNIEEFKLKAESDAVASTHHTVGKWIRNEWGLWTGSQLKDYFVKKGITHPDEMTAVIICAFHRHLNGKPLNIESEIERVMKINV